MLTAGGHVRARVSARRGASGSRYRPAIRRTRSAASAAGIPAAVTNSGRPEDPRTTGTAWVAVRSRDSATPITAMPNSACALRAQAGPAARVQVGVAIDHQQARPTQILQHRTQRRELTQVELARPVGRYLGDHRDAFGQHLREGGNGGQHGCRPGAAGAQVMHVRGGAYAAVRAPAGLHVLRMPEPAPGIRTVSGSCSASLAMLNSPPPDRAYSASEPQTPLTTLRDGPPLRRHAQSRISDRAAA
jgi:hypothetical protein